jgi:hypothetical protein
MGGVIVIIVRRCQWLAGKPVDVQRRICSAKRYQLYSEEQELAPASRLCFETCGPFRVKEAKNAKFIYKTIVKEDGQIVPIMHQCKWIYKQDESFISEICTNEVDYYGNIFGQAYEVCTEACDSYIDVEEKG